MISKSLFAIHNCFIGRGLEMGFRDVKGLEKPLIDFTLISVYSPNVDYWMDFEVYR
jgi:hypothetical protein